MTKIFSLDSLRQLRITFIDAWILCFSHQLYLIPLDINEIRITGVTHYQKKTVQFFQ